ncbi:UMP kinase [Candidatus Micrarchaeota archaeon]|nr:UMP kinase [Candidatus Micrarchaeota archaeon]MBD3417563.1 UMP kinase [Candidatus Micrarchaeota archaeon]
MAVVISLGGSMVNGTGDPDINFLKKFKSLLKGKEKIGIVVGGGKIARDYVKAASNFSKNQFWGDTLAVYATRLNSALVTRAFAKEACPVVFQDFESAAIASEEYRIVVMGGTIPGITTDTDSVLLAEAMNANRVINISNVDGIYDSDPRKNKNAKMFRKMSFKQLLDLANASDKRAPGTNFVFDVIACKLAARTKMELHFVGGKNIQDLPKAMKGKTHRGTIIK